MSFWSDLLSRLGGQPRPPAPPPVPPPAVGLRMHVVMHGLIPGSAISGVMNGTIQAVPLSAYMLEFAAPAGMAYGTAVQLHLEATGMQTLEVDTPLAADFNVNAVPLAPPKPKARTGVVALVGKAWTDAGGPFYPLASTLLWAVGGFIRGEAARVIENFHYLRFEGCDVVRILADVGWKDEEINALAPGYPLGAVIDAAYDSGLRVKLTVIGGSSRDPIAVARAVRPFIAGREHKIIQIEAVNEGNASREQAIAVAKAFVGCGVPVSVGRGDQGLDDIRACGDEAGTNVDVLHTERGGDSGRMARQGWDFHLLPRNRASDDGEPPGPAASAGGNLTDPMALAVMRICAILCGAGSFCLHTGHGVFGRTYPYQSGIVRQANLFDVPELAGIFAAVRNAVLRLPLGIENWSPFNTGHPVEVASGDLDKLYGARTGGNFTEIAIACRSAVVFRATTAVSVTIFNPATGDAVASADLATGQTLAVSGLWAYLLVGTTR